MRGARCAGGGTAGRRRRSRLRRAHGRACRRALRSHRRRGQQRGRVEAQAALPPDRRRGGLRAAREFPRTGVPHARRAASDAAAGRGLDRQRVVRRRQAAAAARDRLCGVEVRAHRLHGRAVARPGRVRDPRRRDPRRSDRYRDLAQDRRADGVPRTQAATERGVGGHLPSRRAPPARGLGAIDAASRLVDAPAGARTVPVGRRALGSGSFVCHRRGARANAGRRVTGRIAIVGAGPAGLVAALAARRLGLDAIVYEQAPALGRVGGGIALQSNGQRVLAALDLLSDFETRLATVRTFRIEGPDGRPYAHIDYGALRAPFARFAVVLRADLQLHLLHAAERAGVRIELGRRCSGVVRDRRTTALQFVDGSTAEASVLLGADGTRSTVRAAGGFVGTPRSVGMAALRGVVELPAKSDVAREIWLDDGRFFGIAPLPSGRTYFYCSAPLGSWSETVERIGPWTESWREAHREAAGILANVGDWSRVTYDELHEVHAPRWSGERCFLLGDAAHAMMPNLGQGANSAMVDALVVVRLLAATGDAAGALDDVGRRYEAIRRSFVRRIQVASHVAGRLATWRSPVARTVRRGMLALGALGERFAQSGLRLGAGVNPAEEPYLRPVTGAAATCGPPGVR